MRKEKKKRSKRQRRNANAQNQTDRRADGQTDERTDVWRGGQADLRELRICRLIYDHFVSVVFCFCLFYLKLYI